MGLEAVAMMNPGTQTFRNVYGQSVHCFSASLWYCTLHLHYNNYCICRGGGFGGFSRGPGDQECT